jgi:hypothetical protein
MSTKYPFFNTPLNNTKNMLLIGNSPNVKEKELGQYINQNNFNIIRFNMQPTKNHEQYIGSHTTYRVINGITWKNNNAKIPPDNIIVAEPPYTPMFKEIQNSQVKKKFKDIHLLPDYTKNYTTIFPTSGLMAITFFLQFYEHIYIYGFSYDGTHFFEKNLGDKHHHYNTEKKIILSLIEEGKIIYLDEKHAQDPKEIEMNLVIKNMMHTNIDISIPINILSIKHSVSNSGKYFHFNRNEINLNKGQTIYANGTYQGEKLNFVLWGYPNGSEHGDSHGKVFDKHYIFKPNTSITINEIFPVISVLAINHTRGENHIGKYFHFDGDTIAHINEKFIKDSRGINNINDKIKITAMSYNVSKNVITPLVIWNYNNGGHIGSAHGRHKVNERKNDFNIGDLLVIIKIL